MKADERAKEILLRELEEWFKLLKHTIKRMLEAMRETDTVETLMSLKRELLLRLIDLLPIDANHCYFCIVHHPHCKECEYAKVHGECSKEESDYYRIYSLLSMLKQEIYYNYYKGERYD